MDCIEGNILFQNLLFFFWRNEKLEAEAKSATEKFEEVGLKSIWPEFCLVHCIWYF